MPCGTRPARTLRGRRARSPSRAVRRSCRSRSPGRRRRPCGRRGSCPCPIRSRDRPPSRRGGRRRGRSSSRPRRTSRSPRPGRRRAPTIGSRAVRRARGPSRSGTPSPGAPRPRGTSPSPGSPAPSCRASSRSWPSQPSCWLVPVDVDTWRRRPAVSLLFVRAGPERRLPDLDQRTGAGRSAGRGCHEVAATTSPLAAVSAATNTIAAWAEVASAPIPAIRAPSTKPKSRQKR